MLTHYANEKNNCPFVPKTVHFITNNTAGLFLNCFLIGGFTENVSISYIFIHYTFEQLNQSFTFISNHIKQEIICLTKRKKLIFVLNGYLRLFYFGEC